MPHPNSPWPGDPDTAPPSSGSASSDLLVDAFPGPAAPFARGGPISHSRSDVAPPQRLALLHSYQAIVEGAAEAIALADVEGRLLYTNRRANTLFGYASHELEGQTLDVLIPEWFEHVAELLRSATLSADRQASASASAPGSVPAHVPQELFGRRHDGAEFRLHLIAGNLAGAAPPLVVVAMRQVQFWTPDVGLTPDAFDRQEDQARSALARALAQVEVRLAAERQNQTLRKHVETARQATTAKAAQMRALQTLTDTALAHLDLETLLPALLDRVRDTLEVDNAIVFLLEEETGEKDGGISGGDSDGQSCLRVRAACGSEAALATQAHVPLGKGFVGRVAATRQPLIASDLSAYPNMRQRLQGHAGSAVGVPLLLEEQVMGVLCAITTAPRQFTSQDVALLERVAERVTVAIERAQRFAAERQARAEAEAARAEAQAARVEAERRAAQLDRIFEQMTDALVVYDADGHVVRENAAMRRVRGVDLASPNFSHLPLAERLMLYGPQDANGHLLAPADTPQIRALRGETLTGERAVDLRMRTLDGRDLELRVSAAPLRDAEGRIIGVVSTGVDLTERNRLMREREEALVASEAWFRTLSDTAPVFIWTTDTEGLATFVNLPWLQFTGRRMEQELGLGWMEGMHPDDYERCVQTYRTAVDARQPFTMDYRLRSADGEYRWLVTTGAPRVAPDGTFLGFIGSAIDISERRQLEEEREEARIQAERHAEELDRVFEAMVDGVAVYDRHGCELRANAAYQRLIGLEAAPANYAELSLQERQAFFAARDEQGRPLTPADGPLPRALAGQIVEGAESMDIRSRTLDGREVELQVSAAPLRSSSGELLGAVSVFRDVTGYNQLMRKVAEQAEELDRIVEAMGEALFVYDKEGRVVRTNAAARRLLGLDAAPPEFDRLPAEERIALYAPRDTNGQPLSPEAWLTLRTARDADPLRAPEGRDIRLRALDGRELEVSASMTPLRAPDGQVVGGVLLLSDRTERNRLAREREEARAGELALREVNQRLDTFVALAAHDLRRPVAVTKMRVELASRQLQKAAATVHGAAQNVQPFLSVAHDLEIAQQSLDQLTGLMEQLLDVTRSRQDNLVLNHQPCDLVELVRTCVEDQRLLAPSRRLTLDLPVTLPNAESQEQPVMVHADAARLGQVVTNYLTNADRYSPADQPIEVSLRVVEQAIDHAADGALSRVACVSVRDHGSGIAPEEQQTIWERFQRAHTLREAQGGLGLGLYIARMIVNLHGGQVGVESTLGEGATFWFTVPLSEAEN